MSSHLAIYLDYSVLDALQRIQANKTCNSSKHRALQRLRASAERQYVEIWISEIAFVEMVHGIEKVFGNDAKRNNASSKDSKKREIASAMFAKVLGYPCAKTDDTYSQVKPWVGPSQLFASVATIIKCAPF